MYLVRMNIDEGFLGVFDIRYGLIWLVTCNNNIYWYRLFVVTDRGRRYLLPIIAYNVSQIHWHITYETM